MNEVIKLLTEKNKTISTMESCTGGGIANAITNIEGSSEVFKFGAVTYSNENKRYYSNRNNDRNKCSYFYYRELFYFY